MESKLGEPMGREETRNRLDPKWARSVIGIKDIKIRSTFGTRRATEIQWSQHENSDWKSVFLEKLNERSNIYRHKNKSP